MLAAHHRVLGMNFIPGGYVVPAAVRDACAEAKSQCIASAPAETDTHPPSPNVDIDFDKIWTSPPHLLRMSILINKQCLHRNSRPRPHRTLQT